MIPPRHPEDKARLEVAAIGLIVVATYIIATIAITCAERGA